MDNDAVCRQAADRYWWRWTLFATVPWAVGALLEVAVLMAKQLEAGLAIDVLRHVVTLSPLLAWRLARNALRGHARRSAHRTPSGVDAPRLTYRSRASVDEGVLTVRDPWILTGVFPRWALVIAALSVGFEAATVGSVWVASKASPGSGAGYLAFFIQFPVLLIGRACFLFAWLSRLYRDASNLAVLEPGTDGRSSDLVLRTTHGTRRAAIAKLDEDTLTLHLEVEGAGTVWSVAWPTTVHLDQGVASVRHSQDAQDG
jgi:hypothetical protein